MSFLDDIFEVVDIITDNVEKYKFESKTLEVFEVHETWIGTARSHAVGKHISTKNVDYSETIRFPREASTKASRKTLFRNDFREWAGKTFSSEGVILKECIALHPPENCLSIEGLGKKISGKWFIVSDFNSATNFISFKIKVYDKDNKLLEHKQLEDLFITESSIVGVGVKIENNC